MQFKESSFWQYSISHIAICAKTLAITSLGNWPTPSFHCWTCARLRDHLSNSWALVLWQTHELPRSVGFDLRIWCSAVTVTVTRVQGRITGHCAFRPVRYIETMLAKWCKSLILSLHIYLRECPSDRRVCSRTIYSYTFRHEKAATEKCWRKPVIKRTSSCSLSVSDVIFLAVICRERTDYSVGAVHFTHSYGQLAAPNKCERASLQAALAPTAPTAAACSCFSASGFAARS